MKRPTRLTFAESGRMRSTPVLSPLMQDRTVAEARQLAGAFRNASLADDSDGEPMDQELARTTYEYLNKQVARGQDEDLGVVTDVVRHEKKNHWCTGKEGDICLRITKGDRSFWAPAGGYEAPNEDFIEAIIEDEPCPEGDVEAAFFPASSNQIFITSTAASSNTIQLYQTTSGGTFHNHTYHSVVDHGAVGDGVVNDTAAIQAALNRANDEYRSTGFPKQQVYCPPAEVSLVPRAQEMSQFWDGFRAETKKWADKLVSIQGRGPTIYKVLWTTCPDLKVENLVMTLEEVSGGRRLHDIKPSDCVLV